MSLPPFSRRAALIAGICYFALLVILAIVPDFAWPEHEFDYWITDRVMAWLTMPIQLLVILMPEGFADHFKPVAIILVIVVLLGTPAVLAGLFAPLLRDLRAAPTALRRNRSFWVLFLLSITALFVFVIYPRLRNCDHTGLVQNALTPVLSADHRFREVKISRARDGSPVLTGAVLNNSDLQALERLLDVTPLAARPAVTVKINPQMVDCCCHY